MRFRSAQLSLILCGELLLMTSLFVVRGIDQGSWFELEGDILRVGRESTCDIVLHDTEVSRLHAELRCDGGEWSVLDLNSSNGTFINGERLPQTEQSLQGDDHLQMGRTLMLFTASRNPEENSVASAVEINLDRPEDANSIVHAISQPSDANLPESAPQDSPEAWQFPEDGHLHLMYRTTLAAQTLDIDTLLQRILDLIFGWIDADRGCVMLFDEETKTLVPKVFRDRNGTEAGGSKLTISRTILDYVVRKNEGVLTSSAGADGRWEATDSIVTRGIKEAICVPMFGRYGVVGVIYVDTTLRNLASLAQESDGDDVVHAFNQEHLKLLIAVGRQAALAVEDTRHYAALLEAEKLAAMGQTVTSVSHCIKNVLQGINSGGFLVKRGLERSDLEMVSKGWDFISSSQGRIDGLVVDMLTICQERQPDVRPDRIDRVVTEVATMTKTFAEELGVKLVCNIPALSDTSKGYPLLMFDTEGIYRAIYNILENAIEAAGNASSGEKFPVLDESLDAGSKKNPLLDDWSEDSFSDAFSSAENSSSIFSADIASQRPGDDGTAIFKEEDGVFTDGSEPTLGALGKKVDDTSRLGPSGSAKRKKAKKAPDNSGKVEVTLLLAKNEGQVRISVKDNGGGIPQDKAREIFKPFFTTMGSQRNGLGLSVAQKIAREHGGDVTADNFSKGAIVTLSFPIVFPDK